MVAYRPQHLRPASFLRHTLFLEPLRKFSGQLPVLMLLDHYKRAVLLATNHCNSSLSDQCLNDAITM
ncbi:hypothetical protein D3C81_1930450 [compost metagenome]